MPHNYYYIPNRATKASAACRRIKAAPLVKKSAALLGLAFIALVKRRFFDHITASDSAPSLGRKPKGRMTVGFRGGK
jgi:hypothetical protein